VLKLNYGTQVPVDSLLLKFSGTVLKLDESSVTGESEQIIKCTIYNVQAENCGDIEQDADSRFSLIVSGSIITEGTA